MLDKIHKIWQEETNKESVISTHMQVFEKNMHEKVLENYYKHFSLPNPSYSLELVQLFSLRSMRHEYETYSDPYPFLFMRKRIVFMLR